MKTLKRTLCLVLAVIMMVGTLAVAASATAFVDDAAIEYAEGVEVLSALKIIEGKDGNKFDPEGTLTRAEAAKIVAAVVLTPDVAKTLSATANKFTDVKASDWFAPYVTYCAAKGILAGVGDNKFAPNDTLTGVQFAKMLLCAMGFDAEREGFNGDFWDTEIESAAREKALETGLAGFVYSANITREQAAQMALNAMMAKKVTYTGTTIVTRVDVDTAPDQLADKYTLVKVGTTNDGTYSRPVAKYTAAGIADPIYAEMSPVLTYTGEVSSAKLYADLGATVATVGTINSNAAFYADGASVGGISIAVDGVATIGGNGATIEVYKVAENDYDIVVIYTYADRVATRVDAVKNAAGEITAKEYITLETATGITTNKFETTAFVDADTDAADNTDDNDGVVVLYTKDNNVLVTVEKAASADVVVSSVTAGTSFVAGGKTYKFSKKLVAEDAIAYSALPGATNAYTVYFDAQGNVILTKAVAGATAATGYAVVLAASMEGAAWSDGSNAYSAKLLMPDGAEKIVTIDSTTYASYDASNEIPAAVAYSIDPTTGVYSFTTSAVAATDTDLDIDAGVSAFTVGGASKNANAKTIFFLGTTDVATGKVTYKVVTGIANMASIEDQAAVAGVNAATKTAVVDGTGYVAAVVILDAKSSAGTDTTAADVAYIQYNANAATTTDALGSYKVYNAVIGGKVTTVKVADSYVATLFGGASVVCESLTYNDKGIVTGADKNFTSNANGIAALNRVAITTAPADGVIEAGSKLSVASNLVIFKIDATGAIVAGANADLKVGAYIQGITTNGVITMVVVG